MISAIFLTLRKEVNIRLKNANLIFLTFRFSIKRQINFVFAETLIIQLAGSEPSSHPATQAGPGQNSSHTEPTVN